MTKNNSNFLWALYNQSKIEYFWDVKCLGPCEAVTVCKTGYWLVDWQVLSTWNTSPQTSVLIRNFTNTGANLVISLTPLTSHLSPLASHLSPLYTTLCSVSPESRPQVTGLQSHYKPGDTVNISCLCPSSFPAANISWFINGNKVGHHSLSHFYTGAHY